MSAAAKARRVNKDAEIIVYEMGDIISFGTCGLPYYSKNKYGYYVGDFFDDPDFMIARKVEQMQKNGINVKVFHQVLSVSPDFTYQHYKKTTKAL